VNAAAANIHPSATSVNGFACFGAHWVDGEHQADHDRRHHQDDDLTDGEVRVGQWGAGAADGHESRDERGDVDNFDEDDRSR
jgi:hypothetical protein